MHALDLLAVGLQSQRGESCVRSVGTWFDAPRCFTPHSAGRCPNGLSGPRFDHGRAAVSSSTDSLISNRDRRRAPCRRARLRWAVRSDRSPASIGAAVGGPARLAQRREAESPQYSALVVARVGHRRPLRERISSCPRCRCICVLDESGSVDHSQHVDRADNRTRETRPDDSGIAGCHPGPRLVPAHRRANVEPMGPVQSPQPKSDRALRPGSSVRWSPSAGSSSSSGRLFSLPLRAESRRRSCWSFASTWSSRSDS
jgi:hypothetical protein